MSKAEKANPETAEAVLDARKEQIAEEEAERLPGQTASDVELAEAEAEVASEEQPDDSHLPQPQIKTVAWRGDDMEWDELGGSIVSMADLYEQGQANESDLMRFMWQTFAEKSADDAATEEYWQQFDLFRSDDTDGLMDLFERLVGASDVPDADAREAAEQFRNERRGDS